MSTPDIPTHDLSWLLPLIADRIQILHSPGFDEGEVGGGDYDCAVDNLDLFWPLRLPAHVKLCQCLRYDVTAWYWVLCIQNGVYAVDTLDDPLSIGKYGVSTSGVLGGEGLHIDAPGRAAYLTAKRLYKDIRGVAEWKHIQTLARDDASRFNELTLGTFGGKQGLRLARSVLNSGRPDPHLWHAARRQQQLRRVRTLSRLVKVTMLGAGRWASRLTRPTGLRVVVVGPDGCGKSTIARALSGACAGMFRRDHHYHWRPGLLPRPGKLIGRVERDATQPHGDDPRKTLASTLMLGYYWVDFVVGTWLLHLPAKCRTTLVVGERGWWDILVDPKRYRINVPRSAIAFLGKLIPAPDLVFLLEATPEVLRRRKDELSEPEIARQYEVWKTLERHVPGMVRVDAEGTRSQVIDKARSTIVDVLEERAMSRLGTGWASVSQSPMGEGNRWLLPRAPRALATEALRIHHPVTRRGLVTWQAARVFSRCGGFRLLRRANAPDRRILERVRTFLPPHGQIAVAAMNHPERFLVMVLDALGECVVVMKLDFAAEGASALEREAALIHRWGPLLPSPLGAPKVISQEHGMIVYEPILWKPRVRPWFLSVDVASALGEFQRVHPSRKDVPLVHGDFAPWNLLASGDMIYLVDWEDSMPGGYPFFDLFHFFVQSSSLLGKPSLEDIVRGLDGAGWIGEALRSYSAASGADVSGARPLMREYLSSSMTRLDATSADGQKGAAARNRLLESLG